MGVLNVTPDSFSDGGLYFAPDAAITQGLQLLHDGADIIDVGGESTRPGAAPVSIQQELQRVIPVIEALAQAGATVSIDTMHAEVAAQALAAGATMVNDVTGGLADPNIVQITADADAMFIASHYRAPAGSPDTHVNPLAEVCAELAQRRDALLAAGIRPEKLILDPGLGFAKSPATNWALLRGLPQIIALGHPVLVGASRKRFLKQLVDESRRSSATRRVVYRDHEPNLKAAAPTYSSGLEHPTSSSGLASSCAEPPSSSSCAEQSGDAGSPVGPARDSASAGNALAQNDGEAAAVDPGETKAALVDQATAAVSVLAAAQGAWGVRVHDVAATRAALAKPASLDPKILDAVVTAWKLPKTE